MDSSISEETTKEVIEAVELNMSKHESNLDIIKEEEKSEDEEAEKQRELEEQKEKELERQRKLEEQKEINRQKELERKKEAERLKELERIKEKQKIDENNRLLTIILGDNYLYDKGVIYIGQTLSNNSPLDHLNLCNNI